MALKDLRKEMQIEPMIFFMMDGNKIGMNLEARLTIQDIIVN